MKRRLIGSKLVESRSRGGLGRKERGLIVSSNSCREIERRVVARRGRIRRILVERGCIVRSVLAPVRRRRLIGRRERVRGGRRGASVRREGRWPAAIAWKAAVMPVRRSGRKGGRGQAADARAWSTRRGLLLVERSREDQS